MLVAGHSIQVCYKFECIAGPYQQNTCCFVSAVPNHLKGTGLIGRVLRKLLDLKGASPQVLYLVDDQRLLFILELVADNDVHS